MSTAMMMYPCNRGMGGPGVGYHHFQANAQGIAVCIYCGKGAER